MSELGILSIATNKYLEYWKVQAESVNDTLAIGSKVKIHLFTDQVEAASEFARKLTRLEVAVYKIPALGWPLATLHRYKIFYEQIGEFTEDILMYLDADMVVHQDFTNVISGQSVTLVAHPGYFRPPGIRRALTYFHNPQLALADLSMAIRKGGLGAWEDNPLSTAFVGRRFRRRYVCGGIWWGQRDHIFNLLESLRDQVASDERNEIMATWHDESHLNNWASRSKHSIVDSRFCYSVTYPWLKWLPNIVQAVDKVEVTRQ